MSNFSIDDNSRTACPIWSNFFFLCNQGLNTLLLVPHKAMLGIMVAFLAKSEKGRCRKIIFPHGVGSVTFFGETRVTILSPGEEISCPPWSSGSKQKCGELYCYII